MIRELKSEIQELEKNHRLITENLIDAIFVLDVNTRRFEYITPSIQKSSGYTSDEYMSLKLEERLSHNSYEKVIELLAEEITLFRKGVKNTRKIEAELYHKSGHTYWTEIKAKFVKENGDLKIIGITREITDQKTTEKHQSKLIKMLGEAVAERDKLLKENKTLRGLLPICSGCKRIRDASDKWWPLDAYVKAHTEADITHTICPDCSTVFYGDSFE